MSTTTAPVLVDLLPKSRVKDAALIVGGAAMLAVASQVLIPLPFTPVPLSLATFAVLLIGASLGPVRAGLSIGLYALVGVVGVPVFAGFSSGWGGASFGYIIGYLAAAVVVGELARRGADRSFLGTFAAAAMGSLVVYAFGVPWLMVSTGVGFGQALAMGVAPFFIGDTVKALAASGLLPVTWKVIGNAAR
ncbi:biotin transporter BioY [Actinomycetaceae bacterium MB13-C1-2]|nr:biotin transporter BioY [Actinomycetaceae bacterium MB13-C1-2]